MRPGPALTLVGAALVLAMAFAGCGDERSTARAPAGGEAQEGTPRQPSADRRAAGSGAGGRRCGRQLAGFLDVLDALRNQLAVGLDYDGYSRLVRDAKSVYDEVPDERLALACLSVAAAPAERALNEYIAGVNIWGGCLAESSCDTESIEPKLQRRWAGAGRFLLAAQRGLRGLRGGRG